LKTSWSCFAKFLEFVARSSNVVAFTFRCGSRYGSPGIDCLEKWGDHWLFVGPSPILRK
jgi:hypothetical protein